MVPATLGGGTQTPPPEPPGGGGGTGGGGGSTLPAAGFSLSPTTFIFNAASPNVPAPADQVVTATYSGNETGTVRFVGLSDGMPRPRAIDLMTLFEMNDRKGRAILSASGPDLLGPGTHTQTITVKACINSDSVCSTNELPGSPQTFSVTYVIGPPPAPPDTVMPRVATAGTSARVIVRGTALSGTTSIHFGPHAATNFSVVSDTEVHATYPALAQGTYAVVLNSGAIPFAGSIVVVPPTNYSAHTLLPEPRMVLSFLRYDAERSALLAGGYHFNGATYTYRLWRSKYDGQGWNSPQTLDLAGLNDAVLSADGSRIFALADDGVIELSAEDLSILHITPRPDQSIGLGSELLSRIAIANNGIALISARTVGASGPNPMYYFATVDRTFRPIRLGLSNGWYDYGLLGSEDGSRILGSVSGIYPAQPLLNYNASTSLRTHILAADQSFPKAATRHAQTIVVDPHNGFPLHHLVYSSQDETLLGVLPGPTSFDDPTKRIHLVEVNPQGTRAYVLREDLTLHTYALDQPTVGDAFIEVGSSITVNPPIQEAFGLITTMTPEGRTLFIGGIHGVLVIPTLD